jgi:predicted nucleic acid-binding protein
VPNFDALNDKRVYLDTNVIIYSAEGFESHALLLKEFFQRMESGSFQGLTSEMTLMEVLVRPIRDGNAQLIDYYERMLGSDSSVEVFPIERRILRRAATIRAEADIKPIDAIHVATAQETNCHFFISDDRGLNAPSIRKISLYELANG